MDTITLELRPGVERARLDTRRLIASLAADMEAQPAYWREAFAELQARALRWPDDALPPEEGLAGDFALALGRERAGPETSPIEQRIARLLIADKRVAVDLSGTGGDAAQSFADWHGALRSDLLRLDIGSGVCAWSMRIDDPSFAAFVEFAAGLDARCFVRVSDAFMLALRDGTDLELEAGALPAAGVRTRWDELVERAARGALDLVLEHHVNAASPLALPEPVDVVLPTLRQASRSAAAMLWFDFDVAAFASGGDVDRRSLNASMQHAVRLGDDLIDRIRWPLEELRGDSRAQRRLSINLVGIGDLVVALGLDPSRFETLQIIVELIRELRRAACRASRSLAAERAPFPALGAESLLSLVPGPELAGEVQARLHGQATRNRHLLSIAPWSVLPGRGGEPRLWANLLPVLRFADSLCFRQPPGLRRLGPRDTDFFLRLAWAYTRQRTPAPGARGLTGAYALSTRG